MKLRHNKFIIRDAIDDVQSAVSNYEKSLAIGTKLAAADSQNASAQQDLSHANLVSRDSTNETLRAELAQIRESLDGFRR